MAKFGGVTLHVDSPAEGLWRDDGEIEQDRIVVAERLVVVLPQETGGAVPSGGDRHSRD